MRAFGGSKSAIAMAVSVFPEPDSPTIPTISPAATLSDTARTGKEPPGNATVRFSTASASPVGTSSARSSVDPTGGTRPPVRSDHLALGRPAAPFASVSPRSMKTSAARTIATGRTDRHARRDEDAAEALAEHPPPVVARGLNAQPEEAQSRERKERLSDGQRGCEEQRLRDVGQHVPPQEPRASDPDHAGSRDIVGIDHRRRERLREPREVRRNRAADPEDRSLGADAYDRRHKDCDQESRERDREIDEARHQPAEPLSDERGQRAERDTDQGADQRGQNRQRDGQSRGDEDAVEDVASQRVRTHEVLTTRTLRGRRNVDPLGRIGPQGGGEERQGHDREDADKRNDPDRGTKSVPPATQGWTPHLSSMVERGSITPRAMSTPKLMISTSAPKSNATPCTAG